MPSDYVDGLDEWQAFQLDVALATKYHLIEEDQKMDMLDSIHASLENLMRVGGAKVKPRKPRQRLVKTEDKDTDEVPLLDDVLKSIGMGEVVLNINESELPKWQGRQLT